MHYTVWLANFSGIFQGCLQVFEGRKSPNSLYKLDKIVQPEMWNPGQRHARLIWILTDMGNVHSEQHVTGWEYCHWSITYWTINNFTVTTSTFLLHKRNSRCSVGWVGSDISAQSELTDWLMSDSSWAIPTQRIVQGKCKCCLRQSFRVVFVKSSDRDELSTHHLQSSDPVSQRSLMGNTNYTKTGGKYIFSELI